ncbi:uncharacterized protein LOC136758249 [Amia ocellicauda]|uniref:uncharacterized protein LOC136758249 n=1 Tax=Amia ocellicauda TaxID=2972642 RepID=UPI00346428D3
MTSSTPKQVDKDLIIAAIEERGGQIKYLDLVNIFKAVLYQADAQERDLQRKCFKNHLSSVTRVVDLQGSPCVFLRPSLPPPAPPEDALAQGPEWPATLGDEREASIDIDFPDMESEAPTLQDRGALDAAGQAGAEEKRSEDEKDDSRSCIPEVVITQADEGTWVEAAEGPASARVKEEAVCVDGGECRSPSVSPDLSADLQSLQSDNGSLAGDATISVKSDVDPESVEDDLRSITTSSVTSLFQRLQMDPLEREWIRFAALGNCAALSQLLKQDPTLASKKVIIANKK